MSSLQTGFEGKIEIIGKGSFGAVSVLSGRPVAFKHVLNPSRTSELKDEFEMLSSLYEFCNSGSFFVIPRPLAYYDPEISTDFCSANTGSPSTPNTRRWQTNRPLVVKSDFSALKLDSAAYAMERVLPLPLSVGLFIRQLFYPSGHETAILPSICRLYFGKVIADSDRPSRFFNSANFPLDVARYTQLANVLAKDPQDDYPTVDEIAHGMGEMLGRLHSQGYDARDIEFVMGGASFSGVAMHVFDWNQMRRWSKTVVDVHLLVEAFFVNDPYYPRPRPEDQLYQNFCVGYMAQYPQDSTSDAQIRLAEVFLREIEAEQARRTSAGKPTKASAQVSS
ncbi:hypothetical protein GALMADRAFT_162381 [Galerina marginata CBS 339.88]|uniref:DUF3669 domain-containing protein n=1 Tax=Galerina marginata (strain CBS 339.88) TaxID=685588 RepID=A0A067S4K2_GALM3|nr:hypothetical protein GALMADRAFT_162381 [Galerina marginata CBS 339.88]